MTYTPTEIETMLQRVEALRHASPEEVRTLVRLGLPRAVEEDGFFFFQDDPAERAYILLAGRVKMIQVTPAGQQVTLRTIGPYRLFGAIGAVNPTATYPASAQALQDSLAWGIASSDFRRLLQNNPALLLDLTHMTTDYLREMQERYREMVTEQVEQRIARVVVRLAGQLGRRIPEGIELTFSRQDLAEIAGTTLYTVSRVLSGWEKRGLILTGRERLVILHPHALAQLAAGSLPPAP
ncbi:Crp/Fnr family transcriptional regulator [Thermanaerothrix daxensis]|nr:Crp/Fnr family transcriptional regulator [Thermanaerothrix daxensis]